MGLCLLMLWLPTCQYVSFAAQRSLHSFPPPPPPPTCHACPLPITRQAEEPKENQTKFTPTCVYTHSGAPSPWLVRKMSPGLTESFPWLYVQSHARTYSKTRYKRLTYSESQLSEPVWPSGKAGKQKSRSSILLRLSLLVKKVVVCGHCLVTLSLTVSQWNFKIALIAAR